VACRRPRLKRVRRKGRTGVEKKERKEGKRKGGRGREKKKEQYKRRYRPPEDLLAVRSYSKKFQPGRASHVSGEGEGGKKERGRREGGGGGKRGDTTTSKDL